jgi:hypothetical protein
LLALSELRPRLAKNAADGGGVVDVPHKGRELGRARLSFGPDLLFFARQLLGRQEADHFLDTFNSSTAFVGRELFLRAESRLNLAF